MDRHTDHSLKVHILLKDADGAVVAEVEDALLKSVVLSRTDPDDGFLYVERHRTARSGAVRDVVGEVLAGVKADAPPSERPLMLRAVLRAAAHRSLSRLADADGFIDWQALALTGRLAAPARAYAAMLAEELILAELATVDGEGVRLAAESGLPEPARILRTLAADYAGASADLLLATRMAGALDEFLATGTPVAHRPEVLEQFAAQSVLLSSAAEALVRAAEAVAKDETPRILIAEPDGRGLVAALLPLAGPVACGSRSAALMPPGWSVWSAASGERAGGNAAAGRRRGRARRLRSRARRRLAAQRRGQRHPARPPRRTGEGGRRACRRPARAGCGGGLPARHRAGLVRPLRRSRLPGRPDAVHG